MPALKNKSDTQVGGRKNNLKLIFNNFGLEIIAEINLRTATYLPVGLNLNDNSIKLYHKRWPSSINHTESDQVPRLIKEYSASIYKKRDNSFNEKVF